MLMGIGLKKSWILALGSLIQIRLLKIDTINESFTICLYEIVTADDIFGSYNKSIYV